MAVPYRQNLDGCKADVLEREDLSQCVNGEMEERLFEAVRDLRNLHEAQNHPILGVASMREDLELAGAALAQLSRNAKTILFFGTGGSSLGGQVLAQVAGWNIPGERWRVAAPGNAVRRPRTRFYDNLDGRSLARALDLLDLSTSRFVIISKSGNTPETLVQAVTALQAVIDEGLESRIPELFLCVSEPATDGAENGLRRLCARYNIPCLDHPVDIGGRYAGLTVVGMLPALARGMDGGEIRAGAQAVIDDMVGDDILQWAPAAGALQIAALLMNGGVNTFVMMPYSDRLGRLAIWYAQLFAESLGKDGRGGTPVAALGPVDQHSQLQLWMDGPREHMVTFIREGRGEDGPRIHQNLAELAGIGYLAGRSAGALPAAQAKAVPEALRCAGRPHRIFDIDELDERAIGGLMMHFMIETILVGALMGVDPFNQPAVETGKRLARDLLEGDG